MVINEYGKVNELISSAWIKLIKIRILVITGKSMILQEIEVVFLIRIQRIARINSSAVRIHKVVIGLVICKGAIRQFKSWINQNRLIWIFSIHDRSRCKIAIDRTAGVGLVTDKITSGKGHSDRLVGKNSPAVTLKFIVCQNVCFI